MKPRSYVKVINKQVGNKLEKTFYGTDIVKVQIEAKLFCLQRKIRAELHGYDENHNRVVIVSVGE
jgi:hypothetical protein